MRRNAVAPRWAGSGILLNVVAPGFVETSLTRSRLNDPLFAQKVRTVKPNLVSNVIKPSEIAEAVHFPVSRQNAAMVGQVIYLDGGAEAVNRGDAVW